MLTISSDDQSKVWLNGKQIYRYAAARPLHAAADKVQGLELKADRNVLVLKVVNGTSDWQSSVSLSDTSGQPLGGVHVSLEPEEIPPR